MAGQLIGRTRSMVTVTRRHPHAVWWERGSTKKPRKENCYAKQINVMKNICLTLGSPLEVNLVVLEVPLVVELLVAGLMDPEI